MSRTERVSKGLVVKQKEQASQLTLPNKSVTKDKLANEVLFGLIPVGAVIPVMPHIAGAFAPGASGTVVNGLMLCDGAAIPTGNTLSGSVPNLSNDRFLMGDTSSGATGGTNNSTHTHTMAHTHEYAHTHQAPHSHAHNHRHNMPHTHTIDNTTININLAHSHTVDVHTHGSNYYARFQGLDTGGNDEIIWNSISGVPGWISNSRYVASSGTFASSGGTRTAAISVGGDSGTSAPGTDPQLSDYSGSHGHTMGGPSSPQTGFQDTTTTSPDNALTTSQSDTTTGPVSTPSTGNPSITENRPQYVSCVYVMRVI